MDLTEKASHVGFIRRSGIFVFLTFLSNVFELGSNGVAARLSEGSYGTFGALFNIFFIIIAPLTAVQLVVSKEVSAFRSNGEHEKIRTFVGLSFRYVAGFSLVIIILGLLGSNFIAQFLRIDSVFPVIMLMLIVLCYFPFPVLYGTTQGMKKFLTLGLLTFNWGFFRFCFGAFFVFFLAAGLHGLMIGMVIASAATTFFAWIPVRSLFRQQGGFIDKEEVLKAYSLVLPIIISLFCVAVLKNADIVFSKKFFIPIEADAYTCAARVGSGFFTLSSIIMVMFPHVSEEKAQSRNPIVFLLKSFGVTIGLSIVGIIIAYLFPGIVMRIITVGEYIPGSEPLIRFIGIAVLPVSLVYIMSNYLLAKHISGFIPILVGGLILQLVLIYSMHQTPMRMLAAVGIANTVTCVVMLIYIIKEHRQYMKKHS
ncbi:hypothetical protein ACFL6H_07665 [Candidatus Latescibacterota bacterium]